MGGVDTSDQSREYYRLRTKIRKFYMYIFTFLIDVAITNSFILYKNFTSSPKLKSIKDFRLKLAAQLTGNYSSRKLPGRRSFTVHPLPLMHFPTKNQLGKRGQCKAATPREQTLLGFARPARSGFVTMVTHPQTVSWHGTRTFCSST